AFRRVLFRAVEAPAAADPGLLPHDDAADDVTEVANAEPGNSAEPNSPDPPERNRAHNAGGNGKRGLSAKQRKRRRWRIIRRTLYALFGIFVVIPAIAFTITCFVVTVPSPESV